MADEQMKRCSTSYVTRDQQIKAATTAHDTCWTGQTQSTEAGHWRDAEPQDTSLTPLGTWRDAAPSEGSLEVSDKTEPAASV